MHRPVREASQQSEKACPRCTIDYIHGILVNQYRCKNRVSRHQHSTAGYGREIFRVEVQQYSIDETWMISVCRYGRWTTMFVSVFMVLVCNITSALINDFWIFFAIRLCLGAFSAMCRNSSMVYSKYSQSPTLTVSLFPNLSAVQFHLVWAHGSVHFD